MEGLSLGGLLGTARDFSAARCAGEGDLLFSVGLWTGSPCLLYLLLEHQSRYDSLMPPRLLIYQARVIDRFLKEHPDARGIPPVLTVVLFHGKGGWRGSTQIADLYEIDDPTRAVLSDLLVQFRFLVDDLERTSDESIWARRASEAARFAWWLMKHARGLKDEIHQIRRWAKEFQSLCRAPGGETALEYLLSYILDQIEGLDPQAVRALFDSLTEPGSLEHAMTEKRLVTIADHLRDEGVKQGLKVGLLEGKRQALLSQIRIRFGALSEDYSKRLSSADEHLVQHWTERILDAASLDELFED